MRKDRRIIRYCFAAFFILCGLIIGILGSYSSVYRHYVGEIPLTDARVSDLMVMYPRNTVSDNLTLRNVL